MARYTADLDSLVGRSFGRRRYQVVARIAQGGMATVYRAHDRRLDRIVALKVPRPELARDHAFCEQFRREARAAARLAHRNIVAVHDCGEERGLPWIVMEHVNGQTLRELLEARGRLDLETTAELLGEVAAALDHAHRAGIVHLDVKPENVLLASDTVKVADFGLVRAVRGGPAHAPAGTVHYLAPEVLGGGPVDARADVYALGVVAYECLTGRPPFDGPDQQSIVRQHLHGRVPPPSRLVPELPARADAAVLRATDPAPARRHPRASELAAELGAPSRRWVDEALRATRQQLHPWADTAVVPGRSGPAATSPARPPAGQVPLGVPRPPRPAGRSRSVPPAAAPASAPPAARWARPTTGRLPSRPPRRSHLVRLVVAVAFALLVLGGVGAAGWLYLAPGPVMPDLAGQDLGWAKAALRARGLRVLVGPAEASPSYPQGTVARQSIPAHRRVHRWARVELFPSAGIAVPAVAGQDAQAAADAFAALGIPTVARHERSPTVPRGHVIRTDPPTGAAVTPGQTVTLVQSDGKPLLELPAGLAGRPPAAVTASLRRLGFQVRSLTVFDDVVPAGRVAGTDPPAGQTAELGSTVTVKVSKGPDLVVVPDVVGLPKGRAAQALRAAGLRPQLAFLTFGDHVIEQSVPAGTRARRGSTVQLVLNAFHV